MANNFKTEEVSLGNKLIVEGEDLSKFFIIAQGQVEVLSKGVHGSDLRIALLTEGEFFGETDLVSDKPSDVTVRTTTPCVLLTLVAQRPGRGAGGELESRRGVQESDRRASRTALDGESLRRAEHRPWSPASPRTSKSRRRSSITRPIRANTRSRPFRRSSACTPGSRTCTTARTISSKSRCGSRSRDQGAAGMGAGQQQQVRSDALGRPGDADQHALRCADAGRSG